MNRPTDKYLIFKIVSIGLLLTLLGCKEPENEAAEKIDNGENLVVVSYGGGAYQQSHIEAFINPFEKSESISIESVVWGAQFGRLVEMVGSGKVKWDVVEVTAAQFARGRNDGMYQPLNTSIDESIFIPLEKGPTIDKYGAPNVYWSTVLAYKRGSFPVESSPQNWADFWNVEKFPGSRALYDSPRGNLEFALLSDGVAIEDLYPIDEENLERAFKILDTIKPHVRVWWKDGTEPVGLLLNGDVVLSSAWSGRIFASDIAKQEINYDWEGAAHELDYWVIPRGSAKVELASQFIKFASSPLPMARQAERTAYGPANLLAIKEVTPEVLPHLPTEPANWSRSFVIDAEWWTEHEAELTARWITWKNK